MILDAGCGNRVMWEQKNNPDIIFIDVEKALQRKPKAAGDNYVFADLSRQDVWEYITHKQRIFEGLHYRIKKYLYLKDGLG